MSLWTRLERSGADRDVWENRLSLAALVLLVLAILGNAGRFFSHRKAPTLPGICLSWLYVCAWFLGTLLLRDRERWLRRTRLVRWIAAASILLGLLVGTGSQVSLLSSLCTLPYVLFVSPYCGLTRKAWVYYALPLVQAVTASVLLRRLRRRKKAWEDLDWGGPVRP